MRADVHLASARSLSTRRVNIVLSAPTQPLITLLELARRVRSASSQVELSFIAVNDSNDLAPYRQAALWLKEQGTVALSGVVQVEANVPYVQWVQRACANLQGQFAMAHPVTADDLPGETGQDWAEWLPAHGLWLPLPGTAGGLLLARDTAWLPHEVTLLAEWIDLWSHAWRALHKNRSWSHRSLLDWIREQWQKTPDVAWWKQRRARWALGIVIVLLFPVRLTVLASGELVPSDPAVIRAPLDGVVASFAVKPNQLVQANQLLFSFDQAGIHSRLEIARQALATAEAEYRQAAQLAVSDDKQKAQLATLTGKIEERRTEADYLQAQLERSSVAAPRGGMVLFDDPSEWIGKPVVTGERIMRIAQPNDIEVEAWLAVGDAIPLEADSAVSMYLNATPLSPVTAKLRYMAHDAVQRPDGSYAYRIRARLDGATGHRVGLKGTVKMRGSWVPLSYWMLRRPLATIRQFIGW